VEPALTSLSGDRKEIEGSRQLGVLRNAGVVEFRRDGTWTYYMFATQSDAQRQRQLSALMEGFSEKGVLRRDLERVVKARGQARANDRAPCRSPVACDSTRSGCSRMLTATVFGPDEGAG
jgi:hypothetical protein